jgi:hypothetical protein
MVWSRDEMKEVQSVQTPSRIALGMFRAWVIALVWGLEEVGLRQWRW